MPNITLPIPGTTPGPDYAVQLNAAITAINSAVDEAADLALFPVYRVWDPVSGSYPARIPGAVNIFFGAADPGLLMGANDYWANPDVTTLASILAELNNPTSALTNATKLAATANPNLVFDASAFEQEPGDSFVRIVGGESPNRHLVWVLPSSSVSRLYKTFVVPAGWVECRLRIFYYHTVTSPSGNALFTSTVSTFKHGENIGSGESKNTTSAVQGANIVTEATSPTYSVTPGEMASLMFSRNANSSSDTFANSIRFLGLIVERAA